jgi:hypothetical protein
MTSLLPQSGRNVTRQESRFPPGRRQAVGEHGQGKGRNRIDAFVIDFKRLSNMTVALPKKNRDDPEPICWTNRRAMDPNEAPGSL